LDTEALISEAKNPDSSIGNGAIAVSGTRGKSECGMPWCVNQGPDSSTGRVLWRPDGQGGRRTLWCHRHPQCYSPDAINPATI